MAKSKSEKSVTGSKPDEVEIDPAAWPQFEKALKRALNTPPNPRTGGSESLKRSAAKTRAKVKKKPG